MQCPRCGSEDIRVFRTNRGVTSTGKHSDLTDTRKVVCDECGLIFVTESVVVAVVVYHEQVKRSNLVKIEEFKRST